jgi:hypothetical protein
MEDTDPDVEGEEEEDAFPALTREVGASPPLTLDEQKAHPGKEPSEKGPVRKQSVADRFFLAQDDQKKRESARLKQVRVEDAKVAGARPISARFEQAHHDEEARLSQRISALRVDKKEVTKGVRLGSGNWGTAIQEMNDREAERYKMVKRKTQCGYEATDGLVDGMIKSWEKLFMQQQASREAILRALRVFDKALKNGSKPHQVLDSIICFYAGQATTHFFSSASFAEGSFDKLFEVLNGLGESQPYAVLSVGVYGIEDEPEPMVDGIAIGLVNIHSEPRQTLLALTVDASEGCEDDEKAYGVHRLVIFHKKTLILECRIELVRPSTNEVGTSRLNSIFQGVNSASEDKFDDSVDIGNYSEVVFSQTNSRTNSKDDGDTPGDAESQGSNDFFSVGEEEVADGDLLGSLESDEGVASVDDALLAETETASPTKGLGYRADIEVDESTELIVDRSGGRSGSGSPTRKSSGVEGAFMDERDTFEGRWDAEDERQVELLKVNNNSVDSRIRAHTVISSSSTQNSLVLHGDGWIASVTGTVKARFSAFRNRQRGVTLRDKVIEWHRGPLMSGTVIKWPMRSQGRGFGTRRHMVLKDNTLVYYDDGNEAAAAARSGELYDGVNSAKGGIMLSPSTVVEYSRRRLRSCVVVRTHLDELFFRCPGKDEERWVDGLQNAIDSLSRRPLFLTKRRIKCLWRHDSGNFDCIGVDAIEEAKVLTEKSEKPYQYCTLFRLQNEGIGSIYSLDTFLINEGKRQSAQLQLSFENSSGVSIITDHSLAGIKLLETVGMTAILYGKDCYVGLVFFSSVKQSKHQGGGGDQSVEPCLVSTLPTGMHCRDISVVASVRLGALQNYQDSKLYAEFCGQGVVNGSLEIILFALGDADGVVSLWACQDRTITRPVTSTGHPDAAILVGSISISQLLQSEGLLRDTDEDPVAVTCLSFLPDGRSVAVGVQSALLFFSCHEMFGPPEPVPAVATPDTLKMYHWDRLCLSRYVLLDRADPGCSVFYSFCCRSVEGNVNSAVMWKLSSSNSTGLSAHSDITRVEFESAEIQAFRAQMKKVPHESYV